MTTALAIPKNNQLEQIHRVEMMALCERALMARRDPRDSLVRAKQMATVSLRVAEQCFYTLPRGEKSVLGPSIRLAEIIANTYGNLHILSRIVDVGQSYVTARGCVTDLESNTTWETECRRSILYSTGARYSEDMIGQTCNAGCSIAMRGAVFKAVPLVLVNEIFEECKAMSLEDVEGKKKLGKAKDVWVQHFAEHGVKEEELLASINRKSIEAITGEDILMLKGFSNRAREENIPLKDAISAGQQRNAAGRRTAEKLSDLTNKKTKETKKDPEPRSESEETF